MHCPNCNSTVDYNYSDEFMCEKCGCEFQHDDMNETKVYVPGSYEKFVENIIQEISDGIIDPSVRSALKSISVGYINEGYTSLPYLIEKLTEEAENLLGQFNAGMREKEDFGSVVKGIEKLIEWVKLHEDDYPEEDYEDVGDDEIEITDPDEFADAENAEHDAINRVKDATNDLQAAVNDLENAEEREHDQIEGEPEPRIGGAPEMGVTDMPTAMLVTENYSYRVGDKVHIDWNSKMTWTIKSITEDKEVIVENILGETDIVDPEDEDRDIQHSFSEDADLVSERAADSRKTIMEKWLALENSMSEGYDKRTPEERQIIDNAVQDIHTDKLQVQDVLPKVPEHLRDDVLAQLRRMGKDHYPERGPDGRGAGPDLGGEYSVNEGEGKELPGESSYPEKAPKAERIKNAIDSYMADSDFTRKGDLFYNGPRGPFTYEELKEDIWEYVTNVEIHNSDVWKEIVHGILTRVLNHDQDTMGESVLGDHFHDTFGNKKPIPYTQDAANTYSKEVLDDQRWNPDCHTEECVDDDNEEDGDDVGNGSNVGLAEEYVPLHEGDLIFIKENFETQWEVYKIAKNPARVYLQHGKKKTVLNPLAENWQHVEGVGLSHEREMEGIDHTRALWESVEKNYADENVGLMPLSESNNYGIHEEEMDYEHAEDERPIISKEDMYNEVKSSEMHKMSRGEALSELRNKYSNDLAEMEMVLDDAVLSETDESVDDVYGYEQMGELDTQFALENAYERMEKQMNEELDADVEAIIDVVINTDDMWFQAISEFEEGGLDGLHDYLMSIADRLPIDNPHDVQADTYYAARELANNSEEYGLHSEVNEVDDNTSHESDLGRQMTSKNKRGDDLHLNLNLEEGRGFGQGINLF